LARCAVINPAVSITTDAHQSFLTVSPSQVF
jgi:hypothetical protein